MIFKNQEVKLTVPNDIQFLPLITHHIGKIAEMTGFKEKEISKIELGTEEAVANVLKHAFEPGEETEFTIITQPMSIGLKLIIKEKGIPFDPSLIPDYKPEKLTTEFMDRGLGTFLMNKFMDEVSFHNLGKMGKETHLIKYFKDLSIEETMNQKELEKSEKEIKEEALPRNSVNYMVRRMKPEEAVDVSKGAYSSYGYTYVLEHIYFPDRVREMNRNNELISYVAVTPENEIIAHFALEIEETDRLTPQLGVAFTKPKYRGQGCMNRLSDGLMEEGYQRGFSAVYARGITTHPYSQKSLLKTGLKECALLLSSGPERTYKGFTGKPQRESVVILLKYLNTPENLTLYPPDNHKKMIEEIYLHLGISPNFKETDKNIELTNDESAIDILTEPHNMVGKIKINQYGKNILQEVQNHLKALCLEKMDTIYLFMKLDNPLTAKYSSEFEKMGFFFSGVMPGSKGKDCLILQYMNNYIIDYTRLQIPSEMGNKIKDYIHSFDPTQK